MKKCHRSTIIMWNRVYENRKLVYTVYRKNQNMRMEEKGGKTIG